MGQNESGLVYKLRQKVTELLRQWLGQNPIYTFIKGILHYVSCSFGLDYGIPHGT